MSLRKDLMILKPLELASQHAREIWNDCQIKSSVLCQSKEEVLLSEDQLQKSEKG